MGEEYLARRAATLGYRPQKENMYNSMLPYAEHLDEESEKLFVTIKTNLVKAVLAHEIRPGFYIWNFRLFRYIKIYGFKLSKEDHIALVKLYYHLVLLPDVDPCRIYTFSVGLKRLLTKFYLLTRDDLQLEWRPLYELYRKVYKRNDYTFAQYRYFLDVLKALTQTIKACSLYFPASATQEILDEFRPMLCPVMAYSVKRTFSYLELFLPIAVKPEEADISYNLWLQEIMVFMETNGPAWENILMWILCVLARFQMGCIDWSPYVPRIFALFQKSSPLTRQLTRMQTGKVETIKKEIMAGWIVFTLNGDRNPTFFYHERLMHICAAAEERCWPFIGSFLNKLSKCFVQRVRMERFSNKSWNNNNVPVDFKLTDADIDRFVNSLQLFIQNKKFCTQELSTDMAMALSYLSSLRPNLVIPHILDHLHSYIGTSTEADKLNMCIKSVTAIGRHMIQRSENNYPEGAKQIIALMLKLLPGMNLSNKKIMNSTIIFMKRFVSMIPLIDCSDAIKYYDDLSEDEKFICAETSKFEVFVLQFLDQLLNCVEFVSLEPSDIQNTSAEIVKMMSNAFWVVLMQSSPAIFQSALRKFFDFLRKTVVEDFRTLSIVANIAHYFAAANPAETFKLLLPYLITSTKDTLLENPCMCDMENVDSKFLFYLHVLSELVDGRDELLTYLDSLTMILNKTLHMKCVKIQVISARMLEVIISSLTTIQPIEYRSSSVDYASSLANFLPIREWAKPYRIQDINIRWYTPKEPAIKAAQRLVDQYLIPELRSFIMWIDKKQVLSRARLKCSLNIVFSILSCHSLLPMWEEPPIHLLDSVVEAGYADYKLSVEGKITTPDGENVRKTVVVIIWQVQETLLANAEADPDLLKCISNIYSLALFNRTNHPESYLLTEYINYNNLKRGTEDLSQEPKLHLRYLHIERVVLQQNVRLTCGNDFFSITHRHIMGQLWALSISQHRDVREHAQEKLFTMLQKHEYSYTVLKPMIQAVLRTNSMQNCEAFKGCLAVLLETKGHSIVGANDLQFIRAIWPLLVASMPRYQRSVESLIKDIANKARRHCCTVTTRSTVPETILQAAYHLANTKPFICDLAGFQKYIDHGEARLEMKCLESRTDYEGTIHCLLSVLATDLHPLYQRLAIDFIIALVHSDVKCNLQIVQYVLNYITNEGTLKLSRVFMLLGFILMQNKPIFHKVEVDPFNVSNTTRNKVLIPGERVDNQWLLYNPETIPTTEAQWEELRYLHNPCIGYYAWPKHLLVYAPPSQQKSVASRLGNMSPIEKAIYDFFSDEANVVNLMGCWLKMYDEFELFAFSTMKNLFKMFEDEFLPTFLAQLVQLVIRRDEEAHSCAAQLTISIIRGSKHWSFEKTEKLWKCLLPILETALSYLDYECFYLWAWCFHMSVRFRDPNRLHWLLEFIMDNTIKDTTIAPGLSLRLLILDWAMLNEVWRNGRIFSRVLEYLKPELSNPDQDIRCKVSKCLTKIFAKDLVFPDGAVTQGPKVKDFVKWLTPALEVLYNNQFKNEKLLEGNNVKAKGDHSSEFLPLAQVNRLLTLFHTVIEYVIESIQLANYSVRPEFWQFLLTSAVVIRQEMNVFGHASFMLVQCTTIKQHIPIALSAIKKVVDCPLVLPRYMIVDFLYLFTFNNIILHSCKDWLLQLQNLVLQLIEDPVCEVQKKAVKLMATFLQFNIILEPMKLLGIFKQKATTRINPANPTGETFRQRQIGIFGICTFVTSFKPDNLVKMGVFETLSRHLNDPDPIPAIIRDAIISFKKGNQRNLEIIKSKLTRDQLVAYNFAPDPSPESCT